MGVHKVRDTQYGLKMMRFFILGAQNGTPMFRNSHAYRGYPGSLLKGYLGFIEFVLTMAYRKLKTLRMQSARRAAALVEKRDPSAQYVRTRVPNAIKSMVCGTRNLKNWVL